ncbi:hypothetical protein C884_00753 [Kocuria palustris PEL]|uniref:Uncharacterized protein n=1 Tax=Kocuria palustris PEL TaxID=1236550 RepID=M2YBX6_9MICC|nr:hypothetical protein C884_00753 [Kocuria palustris PEL]
MPRTRAPTGHQRGADLCSTAHVIVLRAESSALRSSAQRPLQTLSPIRRPPAAPWRTTAPGGLGHLAILRKRPLAGAPGAKAIVRAG